MIITTFFLSLVDDCILLLFCCVMDLSRITDAVVIMWLHTYMLGVRVGLMTALVLCCG